MRCATLAALIAVAAPGSTPGASAVDAADPFIEVGLEERLGAPLGDDLVFADHRDRPVALADLADGERPTLVVPAYYRCPMLCGLVLRDVGAAMDAIDLRPGVDYRVATVSFDERDDAAAAAERRRGVLAGLERAPPAGAWPFLHGDAAAVDGFCRAIGLRVRLDEATGEIAHPAVVVVLAPDGTVSRYLYGIEREPRDLELALIEAGRGNVGGLGARLLMFCFHYDPSTRRYGLFVANFLRLGALLTMALAGGAVLWAVRRRRRTR